MSKINVCIIGAGGHTRSLLNIFEDSIYNIIGIFDDNYIEKEVINGYRVLGKPGFIEDTYKIILSIGDNIKREELFNKFRDRIIIDSLIHPTAYIEKNVNLMISNQVLANAYINSNTLIGNNNIINTGCIIEHECKIGSHNHISVNSILCGRVKIGDRCFIGAGSVVIDKITICSDVTIGANSVVIDDIRVPGIYVGNPVRKIK